MQGLLYLLIGSLLYVCEPVKPHSRSSLQKLSATNWEVKYFFLLQNEHSESETMVVRKFQTSVDLIVET